MNTDLESPSPSKGLWAACPLLQKRTLSLLKLVCLFFVLKGEIVSVSKAVCPTIILEQSETKAEGQKEERPKDNCLPAIT